MSNYNKIRLMYYRQRIKPSVFNSVDEGKKLTIHNVVNTGSKIGFNSTHRANKCMIMFSQYKRLKKNLLLGTIKKDEFVAYLEKTDVLKKYVKRFTS